MNHSILKGHGQLQNVFSVESGLCKEVGSIIEIHIDRGRDVAGDPIVVIGCDCGCVSSRLIDEVAVGPFDRIDGLLPKLKGRPEVCELQIFQIFRLDSHRQDNLPVLLGVASLHHVAINSDGIDLHIRSSDGEIVPDAINCRLHLGQNEVAGDTIVSID